jgi:phytoene dehydrogenase-like protein
VLARQVLGPYEIEQDLGMLGGNIFHGELSVDQLFHMRPSPGFADYRTPVRGLYHASSATHGGGGVTGIPGYMAVRSLLHDKKHARS